MIKDIKNNNNLFSTLLCRVRDITPEKGDTVGTCCICGKHTNTGHKKKKKLFSGNFTSSNYISDGEVLCPECYYLLKNSNEYRRTMFLLTNDEYKPFKKQEAKEVVMNLPNKPFYLYLTKTWQQIGWIIMNNAYNNDNTGLITIAMDYDLIHTKLDTVKEYCDFIRIFRRLKIPKTVLETGKLEPHHYKKIVEEYDKKEARRLIKQLNSYVKTPSFDLALYLEE